MLSSMVENPLIFIRFPQMLLSKPWENSPEGVAPLPPPFLSKLTFHSSSKQRDLRLFYWGKHGDAAFVGNGGSPLETLPSS